VGPAAIYQAIFVVWVDCGMLVQQQCCLNLSSRRHLRSTGKQRVGSGSLGSVPAQRIMLERQGLLPNAGYSQDAATALAAGCGFATLHGRCTDLAHLSWQRWFFLSVVCWRAEACCSKLQPESFGIPVLWQLLKCWLLIDAQPGSGLCKRSIHRNSPRRRTAGNMSVLVVAGYQVPAG
jgi:hypothetical protein